MKQHDLYDEDTGKARRDAGMERAEKAAPKTWKDAVQMVVETLAKCGKEFTADDVWAVVHPPRDQEKRALGSILRRAAREGKIQKVGYRDSRRKERHCGPVTVWRGVT